ncbi:response regulator [Anaerosporobacter faecicola]|uniref:response regulator n=1 Tax=Anaerosporobacter faecicola TaxID=2718714 RepID=UPI001EE4EFBB|nr:response regulator [Anaerosporobacter faecicola]
MLKTILVDDEMLVMEQFEIECEELEEVEVIGKFNLPSKAIQFVQGNRVDIAILDIEMPEMNGIELGKKLRSIQPDIVLIYITGYENYALEAFQVYAAAYILKPFDAEEIMHAIQTAKLLVKGKKKDFVVKTFGRFDLFVQDKLVSFTNAKAKELLAICVDRQGGTVTMEEAIDKLWEDREYDDRVKNLYRKTIVQLTSTLKQAGAEDIFINQRGVCYIDKEKIECDYYELLKENSEVIVTFHDEYMFEYSWAEKTLLEIEDFLYKKNIEF